VASWIFGFLRGGGYLALAALTLIENLFPPIPSELIIPLAGYLARDGDLTMWGVVIAATGGSVIGALPLYWIGRRMGAQKVERWAERHGRWAAVSPDEIRKAREWFRRHGNAAVFFGRVMPGIRSLISLPAGMAHMGLTKFLVYTTAGSLIWSALLAGAGFALGAAFGEVDEWLDPVSWVVFAGILGWYVWRVVRRGGRPRAK
jgi:membrane protein DedA with SNARE-associated domain